MRAGRLHILGVRHHSPACARLVAHTIARLRPAVVLIEGPADMNARLPEFQQKHRLPVAVFSFRRGEPGRASFSPFCETSPEWAALRGGFDVGADVAFMDLPAWDKAFVDVENRYSDGDRRHSEAVKQLCRRFHVDGYDALWDHLFEAKAPAHEAEYEDLQQRLDAYFDNIRNHETASARDLPREALMRAFVAAALARTEDTGGEVVVVCGGFHAPILMDVTAGEHISWPDVEHPDDAFSYLVPWSFARLDAFRGYAAGMPSPAFYQDVFTLGPAGAVDAALRSVVIALRDKGQAISSADIIAARTMAEGLARLRGHDHLLRGDLLDGLAAALIKTGLEAPVPWSESGRLRAGTDPMLVEVVRVLSGDAVGLLAPGTPQPPLVQDVDEQLISAGLTPTAGPARTQKLRLANDGDRLRSQLLHKLRLLEVPGFARSRGPSPLSRLSPPTTNTTDSDFVPDMLEETWVIADHQDRLPALIEAAAWGATLDGAVGGRLEAQLAAPAIGLDDVAAILGDAVLVGLHHLSARALETIRRQADHESNLATLGAAVDQLLGLFRTDGLFGVRHRGELEACIAVLFDRGLWLLEQQSGSSTPADGRLVDAVRALRDVAREKRCRVDGDTFSATCARRLSAEDAPPAVRGACLGALWSLGALTANAGAGAGADSLRNAPQGNPPGPDAPQGNPSRPDDSHDAIDAGTHFAVDAVRRMARPLLLGDFLAGLFALARETAVNEADVINVVDEVVSNLDDEDFLIALPSLRLAFSFFPPRERVILAERIAIRHGASPANAHDLLRLEVDVDVITNGTHLDALVQRIMKTHGLRPPRATPVGEA